MSHNIEIILPSDVINAIDTLATELELSRTEILRKILTDGAMVNSRVFDGHNINVEMPNGEIRTWFRSVTDWETGRRIVVRDDPFGDLHNV